MTPTKINPAQNNLLQQTPAPENPGRAGLYKNLVLDAATVLCAALSGWVYMLYLKGHVAFWGMVSVFTLFIVLSVFCSVLTKSLKHRLVVLVGEAAGLLVFFLNQPTVYLEAAAVIMVAFLLWGELAARWQMRYSLELRFMKTSYPLVSKLITALLVMVILLFLPQLNDNNFFLSQKDFQKIFSRTARSLEVMYPGVDLQNNVGTFFRSVAERQLDRPEYQQLPAAAQEKVVAQAIDQILVSASRALHVPLNPAQGVASATYDIITTNLARWQNNYTLWFSVGWAVVVFFIARSVGVVAAWVITVAAYLIYQLLIALNLLKVTGEPRTREVLEIA